MVVAAEHNKQVCLFIYGYRYVEVYVCAAERVGEEGRGKWEGKRRGCWEMRVRFQLRLRLRVILKLKTRQDKGVAGGNGIPWADEPGERGREGQD